MTSLLADLSKLPHDKRVARLVELGRACVKGDSAAKGEVDKLGQSDDAFARYCAVWTCFGSRDGGLVLRMVHDVSSRVRRLAFRVGAVVCDDHQVFDALQVAYATRNDKAFLVALHARRRIAALDRGLDWLAERPSIHDFADVVPLGSRYAVKKHLARALDRPSSIFWDRLARNHADILAEVLAQRIRDAGEGESDPITRQLVTRHHRMIAEHAPKHALMLAGLLAEREIASDARIWRLIAKDHLKEILDFWATAPSSGALAHHRQTFEDLKLKISVERANTLPVDVLAQAVRAGMEIKGELDDIAEDRRRVIADAWAEVAERRPRYRTALLAWSTSPERREEIYALWRAASMDRDGVISIAEVALLPLDLAEREGRRHFVDVVALTPRPTSRILYTQFLPYEEAQRAVKDYLGHPDGATRAIALSALLQTPRYRPNDDVAVDKLLDLVVARKNEQDPVRQSMLSALTHWPRDAWKPKHTVVISQIIRDALDASDLSHGTATFGEMLIIRTFRLDPDWGAELLGVWLKERGNLINMKLDAHFTDEELKRAGPQLLELVRTWSKQERFHIVINLVTSLAKRGRLIEGFFDAVEEARDRVPWGGWAVELTRLLREYDEERHARTLPAVTRKWLDKGWYGELIGLANSEERGDTMHDDLALALERIAARSGSQHQAISAVQALASRASKRFADRIERMLDTDPSLVALPVVEQYLHRRRQDLITRYLEGGPVTGRFATGQAGWVLSYAKDFWRWNTKQSELFAQQHGRIIRDLERDTPTILRSLVVLPELCWGPMADLASFADDERPVVKDKALRVLARCDQAQGVPTLLRCLEDERARIAIYGLRRALRQLPPSRSLPILKQVPLRKVTVAKETVRLLGELRSDEAYAFLLELDKTELHRDVRIALLRALWDHLEREETWAVYERAVSAPDWIMASRLGDIPADRLTRESDARLSKLLARVVSREEPEARIDLLRRAALLAIRDPERTFLAACRGRLHSLYDDEVSAAMLATLHRSDESDIPALSEVLSRVSAEDKRMFAVAVHVIGVVGAVRRVFVMASAAAESVAAQDPALTPTRIRLAGRATATVPEIVTTLESVASAGLLSSDTLIAMRSLIDALPVTHMTPLEERLAESAHSELRRLAVYALVRDAGLGRGWTEERLERLAAHQRDPEVSVRAAADQVFPPREIAPRKGARGQASP